jgi:AcrR family transcriptional regulator
MSTADRQARRRAATRARLITAAMERFATQGIAETRISDITARADLGFGSFYNYFDSKEALVDALLAEQIEPFGAKLDRMSATIIDPAERVAASVRHVVRRAITEPSWGGFLLRIAFKVTPDRIGFVPRVTADISAGSKAGRFSVTSIADAVTALSGIALAFIARGLAAGGPPEQPERSAAQAMRLLGLSAAEADQVARRPLPALPG